MTESDREKLIALIVDSPEQLSENERKVIEADSELRELSEISHHLRIAAQNTANIDAEWELFSNKLDAQQSRPKFHWRRITAIIALTLTLSATAAILFVPEIFIPAKTHRLATEQIEQPAIPAELPITEIIQEKLPTKQIVFNNIPLAEVIAQIAEIYGCKFTIEPDVNDKLRLYLVIEAGQSLDATVKILDAFEAFDVSVINGTIIVK